MKPKKRFFAVLRHGALMVRRNLQRYAMLSVTIVLSLSFLLGYLLYTDASLYNRYKELFSWDRGNIAVHELASNARKMEVFLQEAGEVGETISYLTYQLGIGIVDTHLSMENSDGTLTDVSLTHWNVMALPDYCWTNMDWVFGEGEIVWLDGRKEFRLEADECVVSEQFFFALGLDKMEDPSYDFKFVQGYCEHDVELDLHIAGYIQDTQAMDFSGEHMMNQLYSPRLLVSTKLLDQICAMGGDGTIIGVYGVLYTDSPAQVEQLAEKMGYDSIWRVYSAQDEALAEIRSAKGTKATIACAMLLLLGINLYSSFSNALNERKFEIGVKRALGASAWSIVRQFLYESLIVMVVNILISVALVTDIFIVYKVIYEHTPDQYGTYSDWILYISPHSVAMFGLCAVTLTVVFSLIFAYKSTRVEIVQYLKAE